MPALAAAAPPTLRTIAEGADWRVAHVVCRAGPADRPYEERHDWATVAAVLDGTFTYRSAQGRSLLLPGALLLGNAGTCFECGHAHGAGDQCIACHIHPALFDETAGAFGRGARAGFRRGAIPPVAALLPAFSRLRRLARSHDAMLAEQMALDLVAQAVALDQDANEPPPRLRDEMRIATAARFMAAHHAEKLTIAALARQAGLGRRRFAAVFRMVAGVTPYAYLLGLRLDAAARQLEADPRRSVLDIALAAGFGDLSEFTRRFRARFGVPPARYRRLAPAERVPASTPVSAAPGASGGATHNAPAPSRPVGPTPGAAAMG